MKQLLFLIAALCLSQSAWSETTYTYTGPTAVGFNYVPPCGNSLCANYPIGVRASVSFTTATPLPANLPMGDITSRVIRYSFADGIGSYSSVDPNFRVVIFQVATDANGNIADVYAWLHAWLTGSTPHVLGVEPFTSYADRLSLVVVLPSMGNSAVLTQHNAICVGSMLPPIAPSPDTCIGTRALANEESHAIARGTGTWSSSVGESQIPTLSAWNAALLAFLVATFALLTLHRRRGAGVAAGCREDACSSAIHSRSIRPPS